MSAPASCSQVIVGTEQLEESIDDTFVDVEKWSERRVESLYGTAGPVSFLHSDVYGVENLRGAVTGSLLKHSQCAEEMLLVSTAVSRSLSLFEVLRKAINDACQAYRDIAVTAR